MALVDEATLRSGDVRLRRMVFEMGSYHGREISLLEQWASDWEAGTTDHFPGHVDDADVARLAELTGVTHDVWWLRLMIEHHEGAIDIARAALEAEGLAAVDAMAAQVEQVQSAEIIAMHDLLDELCHEATSIGCPTESD